MEVLGIKYFVRVYRKTKENESWQTLGPYSLEFATEVMYLYLKKGVCSWIEDVKFYE